MLRRQPLQSSRHRTSSTPCGSASTGRCVARWHCAFLVDRAGYFCGLASGMPCRCTRPNSCSTSVSARTSRSGQRSVWSACSFPADLARAPLRSESGANGVGDQLRRLRDLLRQPDRAEISPVLPLVYLMVLTQGARYGLTVGDGAGGGRDLQGKHTAAFSAPSCCRRWRRGRPLDHGLPARPLGRLHNCVCDPASP